MAGWVRWGDPIMPNSAKREQVMAALGKRARRRKVVAALGVLLVVAGLALVGVRAHALATEFPNPSREVFQAGEQVPYPAYDEVSLRVAPAQFLTDDEVRELCPDTYKQNAQQDGRYRMVRVDVTVRNDGEREIELFDLRSSALVLGQTYGNQSFMPAEYEAFPDIDYAKLAAGSEVTLPLLYVIWDYTLPAEMWDTLDQMPLSLQVTTWPSLLTVAVGKA